MTNRQHIFHESQEKIHTQTHTGQSPLHIDILSIQLMRASNNEVLTRSHLRTH